MAVWGGQGRTGLGWERGKGTGVVEGTVTGIAAGLEGEIVTGLVAGTVMMVGVSDAMLCYFAFPQNQVS